jgi:CBS domain-containing protein
MGRFNYIEPKMYLTLEYPERTAMFARDLMTTPVITIREDATVAEAARLMLDRDISVLPVLNGSDRLVGILTHSDYGLSPKFRPLVENVYSLFGSSTTTHHLEETARQIGSKRVGDVMRRDVITVRQDDGIEHVARVMMRSQIHRLPVVDGGKLEGIITRHDLLKLIARGE